MPTPPPTTSSTSDPWAVPTTIDAAYLNRVLVELNHIDGDAFRDVRRAAAITPTFVRLETSIRADASEVQLNEKDWQSSITDGFRGIKPVPGDRRMEVIHILNSSPPCVLSAVTADFSGVTVGIPRAYPPWYVAVLPRVPTADNPTHWAFIYDGFEPSGSQPDPAKACALS